MYSPYPKNGDKKSTGIVRRIDDLGRIVIPREIRRTLGMRDGDPLELYLDNEGHIVLCPHDFGKDAVTRIQGIIYFIESLSYIEVSKQDEIIKKLREAIKICESI